MTITTSKQWAEVAERVRMLKLRSKMGYGLTPEDQHWLERCWKQYPKEYATVEDEVREEAARRVRGER